MSLATFDSSSFLAISAPVASRVGNTSGHVRIDGDTLDTICADLAIGAAAARATASGAIGRNTAGKAVYRLPRPLLVTGEAICDEQWAAMERACGVRAPRQVVAD